MEFKKERVFTAVTADELKPGDRVIVADDLDTLKRCVKNNSPIDTISMIGEENYLYRFGVKDNCVSFALAYLVERAEKASAWFVKGLMDGSIERTSDEVKTHYRPFKDTDELIKVWEKKVPCNGYRPRGTRPLIWVHRDDTHEECLIVTFDNDSVYLGHRAVSLHELWEHFTFLDGSVCGVEE